MIGQFRDTGSNRHNTQDETNKAKQQKIQTLNVEQHEPNRKLGLTLVLAKSKQILFTVKEFMSTF